MKDLDTEKICLICFEETDAAELLEYNGMCEECACDEDLDDED